MKHRPWIASAVFCGFLAVLFGSLAWMTQRMLSLERAQVESAQRAQLEENVRLALWRIDSSLSALVAQENARPYFSYASFYAAESAYNAMFSQWRKGDVQIPSNLLAYSSPNIKVHFQLEPNGTLSSPQAPTGNMRDLAEAMYVSTQSVRDAAAKLDLLRQTIDWQSLRSRLPSANLFVCPGEPGCDLPTMPRADAVAGQRASNVVAQQIERTANEYKRRAEWNAQSSAQSKMPALLNAKGVREGWMRAEWVGDKLLLIRRVLVDEREYLQGCWLDWEAIERTSRSLIADLLPSGRLQPIREAAQLSALRSLATLPVAVDPGVDALPVDAETSPVRWTLILAWVGAVLAAAGIGLVTFGAVALGERRATFVSAVTHELRTPLTTFRLYTDMLERGIVDTPAKQVEYFAALRQEADRLGHLVDNVLAFSKLERGSNRCECAPIQLATLLERCWPRLAERAESAGMKLLWSRSPVADSTLVRANEVAVERIVFNLVDNACKYGQGGTDEIQLQLDASTRSGRLIVRDCGPGVAPQMVGKLFRPFSKSAEAAAKSQPGVGLGLALSRRLARSMGGELAYEKLEIGAQFELTLPAA